MNDEQSPQRIITKVKIKDEEVVIEFKEDAMGAEKESVFKSVESAHPDFIAALQDLVSVVYHILQLPEDWRMGYMDIRGVSFSHSKNEVEGATINGLVALSTSNSPFCFNTPYLAFDQYNEASSAPVMSDDAQDKLWNVKQEALQYMDGKRAQMSLDL